MTALSTPVALCHTSPSVEWVGAFGAFSAKEKLCGDTFSLGFAMCPYVNTSHPGIQEYSHQPLSQCILLNDMEGWMMKDQGWYHATNLSNKGHASKYVHKVRKTRLET